MGGVIDEFESSTEKQKISEAGIKRVERSFLCLMYWVERILRNVDGILVPVDLLGSETEKSFLDTVVSGDEAWDIEITFSEGTPGWQSMSYSYNNRIALIYKFAVIYRHKSGKEKFLFSVLDPPKWPGLDSKLRSALTEYCNELSVLQIASAPSNLRGMISNKLKVILKTKLKEMLFGEHEIVATRVTDSILNSADAYAFVMCDILDRDQRIGAHKEIEAMYQKLISETSQRIDKTRRFTKSRTLEGIRRDLEHGSSKIAAEINK